MSGDLKAKGECPLLIAALAGYHPAATDHPPLPLPHASLADGNRPVLVILGSLPTLSAAADGVAEGEARPEGGAGACGSGPEMAAPAAAGPAAAAAAATTGTQKTVRSLSNELLVALKDNPARVLWIECGGC